MPVIGGFTIDDMKKYSEVRAAFDGEPRRAGVTPSDWLYRFDAMAKVAGVLSDYSKSVSAWWFPKPTYQAIIQLHKSTDIPLDQIARSLGAIAFNFKEVIDSLVRGQLVAPKPGLKGRISPKALKSLPPHPGRPADLERIWTEGGLTQLWIPDLKRRDFSSMDARKIPAKGRSTVLFAEE